ncbi:MAG: carboxypeptidase regulatory-like domain-containing protein [Planctomycetota bacterium]|nr:MAG: carboxypeptidase regulatory-like domain-containing protein [Planctomycetota bacterium]
MRLRLWIYALALLSAVLLCIWALNPLGTEKIPSGGQASNESAIESGKRSHVEVAQENSPEVLSGESQRHNFDPAAGEGRVVLEFHQESAGPLGGIPCVLIRKDEILLADKTDSKGRISYSADSQMAEAYLAVPGRVVARIPVLLQPGHHRYQVSSGSSIAGRASLEDGAPAPKLRFSLAPDSPLYSWTLPDEAWQALGFSTPQRWLWATTLADGSFSFSGLPEDFLGTLHCPYAWRITYASSGKIIGKGSHLQFKRPDPALELRLQPAPFLKAKLVDAATDLPAVGVSLYLAIKYADRMQTTGAGVESDEDGQIAVRVDSEALANVTFKLGEIIVASFQQQDIPANLDLGTIRIRRLREVLFDLVDLDGNPIAGGKASVANQISQPTNQLGRGALRNVPMDATSMRIVADGFEPARVPIPANLAEPIRVVLRAANRLEIRILTKAGQGNHSLHVGIRCEQGILQDPDSGSRHHRDHIVHHGFTKAPDMKEGRCVAIFGKVAPDGTVIFRGLTPDHELQLQVLTFPREQIYYEENLAPLSPSENRVVEVDLRSRIRQFQGRVMDADGNPLIQAWVDLTGHGVQGLTDQDGKFSLTTLSQDPTTLLIQKTGFAALYLHNYLIPADGTPVEFHLNEERRVLIAVVDPNGTPVTDSKVLIQKEGFSITTRSMGAGKFEASELDDTPLVIVATVAGRRYRQPHDPVVSEATVIVPLHGSVRISLLGQQPDACMGRFLVSFYGEVEGEAISISESFTWQSRDKVIIPFIFPTEYQVSLNYFPSEQEAREGVQPWTRKNLLSAQVSPGKETVLRLPMD